MPTYSFFLIFNLRVSPKATTIACIPRRVVDIWPRKMEKVHVPSCVTKPCLKRSKQGLNLRIVLYDTPQKSGLRGHKYLGIDGKPPKPPVRSMIMGSELAKCIASGCGPRIESTWGSKTCLPRSRSCGDPHGRVGHVAYLEGPHVTSLVGGEFCPASTTSPRHQRPA